MQRNVSPDDDDHLEEPEFVPSFLTARELEAKDPAKGEKDPDPAAAASGLPEEQADKPERRKPEGK